MRPFTIYSFFTQNSPYKEIYEKYLLASAKKLNIEVKAIEAPNYHHWGKNVAQKPLMILKIIVMLVMEI